MAANEQTSTGGAAPLLDIADLRVRFRTPTGLFEAVRGVSLQVGRERVAVVGESGSGKSVSFRSWLGLLPPQAEVSAGHVRLEGQELLGLPARELRALRGGRVGMVVQDPRQGLDPVRTVAWQLTEMMRLHRPGGQGASRQRLLDALDGVHIREPQRVLDLYPHQLSGGMAQRVMIAMMLLAEPRLLIADEATSALDAAVRRRILELIDEQVRLRGMGLVLISHDLDLVARFADRILVMYAGRVVEELVAGPGGLNARHPYTQGLLACRPSPAHEPGRLPVLSRDASWLTN